MYFCVPENQLIVCFEMSSNYVNASGEYITVMYVCWRLIRLSKFEKLIALSAQWFSASVLLCPWPLIGSCCIASCGSHNSGMIFSSLFRRFFALLDVRFCYLQRASYSDMLLGLIVCHMAAVLIVNMCA